MEWTFFLKFLLLVLFYCLFFVAFLKGRTQLNCYYVIKQIFIVRRLSVMGKLLVCLAEDMTSPNAHDGMQAAGINSILPKEHGSKFYTLPVVKNSDKDV